MIVRILGCGQWVLAPEVLLELQEIDQAVEQAVADDDQPGLAVALEKLSAAIMERGTEVPDDVIVESDLVLPDAEATVAQMRELFEQTSDYYGLLPDGSSEK
ncbi:MAG: hypothetical protein CSA64_04175 [Arachnia propionica]|nr:MAG: hypothetical protein CSA64_04175 [Arachnia propionica]